MFSLQTPSLFKIKIITFTGAIITDILNEIHSYESRKDQNKIPDSSSILFEISPGVGGKESMLFANELYSLYSNYFHYKNWKISNLEADEDCGYLRHCKARIDGHNDVWACMKFEAGVHRVQRIPATESRGRIHTSTVSIACIPITDESGVEINGKFFDTFSKFSSLNI